MTKKWYVAGVLVLSLVLVGVVYAAELVSNGDFAAGTSYWQTATAGDTLSVDQQGSDCPGEAELADFTSDDGVARAEQCIRIVSPGTDWTLSGYINFFDADEVVFRASFYSSNDCSTGLLRQAGRTSATGNTVVSNPFTYDTAANGAQSVLVDFAAVNTSRTGNTFGCFDDISLAADGATVVTGSHVVAAAGQAPGLWLAATALLLGTMAALWRRQ